jgi:hypothetical protein
VRRLVRSWRELTSHPWRIAPASDPTRVALAAGRAPLAARPFRSCCMTIITPETPEGEGGETGLLHQFVYEAPQGCSLPSRSDFGATTLKMIKSVSVKF